MWDLGAYRERTLATTAPGPLRKILFFVLVPITGLGFLKTFLQVTILAC